MVYNAPFTAISGNVLTAAQWNSNVRDNILETATAKATTAGGYFVAQGTNSLVQRTQNTVFDATSVTTNSTSYVSLNGSGATVSATTGTSALVFWKCRFAVDTVGNNVYSTIAVSGATTIAANESYALWMTASTANYFMSCGTFHMFTGLTPGSNTFTMQHRVTTGGTVDGTWDERYITVLPF